MTNQKVQQLAASYQQKLRTRVADHRREMGVEDAPTEPIDIEEMWTAAPAGKELEPIKTYDPDNDWRKRAWVLDGRGEWELWTLAALKLRHINALEDFINQLEQDDEWRKPIPARSARVFHFRSDIIASHT